MDELRFDGRVAIVTGGGRGIGRAYAGLLAARGAKVVVNDLGGTRSGAGGDPGPAEAAAAELRAAGGEALADWSDVSSADGAAMLVARALDEWGRVDIVVNNAGIFVPDEFPDVDLPTFRQYFDVHAGGSFNVTRACWPHMERASYGRVVMTTSSGIFGARHLTSYGSAKGAVFALTRTLAVVGEAVGIKVNGVAPVAATRLTGAPDSAAGDDGVGEDSPALVAPLVVLLCHEGCPVTGETFTSGGRRQARIFVAETEGYVYPDDDLTPEAVVEHWVEIMDESRHAVARDTMTWLRGHQDRIAATTSQPP